VSSTRPNQLKRKLKAGETALGFWLSTNSLAVTEMAAGGGWDWVLLDMEHTAYDVETVERHMLAAHHGGDAEFVVRVPNVDPALMKRLMDAGVRSYMFPYVDTVEEARLAVATTRYPPHGIRGFAGGSRATRFGRDADYLKSYSDDVFVCIQIESARAVDAIGAYGTIDGIDSMLIGANDLAADLGHLGDTRHAEVTAKFDEAATAIMATGKAAGFQFFDERAAELIARGFTFAAVEGDTHTLLSGMAASRGKFT